MIVIIRFCRRKEIVLKISFMPQLMIFNYVEVTDAFLNRKCLSMRSFILLLQKSVCNCSGINKITMHRLIPCLFLFVSYIAAAPEKVPPEFDFVEVQSAKKCKININSRSFHNLFKDSESVPLVSHNKAHRMRTQDKIADGIMQAFLYFARRKRCDILEVPLYNVSRALPERKGYMEARNKVLRKSSLFGTIYKNLKRHEKNGLEDFYRPPMYNGQSLDFVRDDEPFYRVILFGRRKLGMKVQGSPRTFEVSPYWDRRELYSKDIFMWGAAILVGALNVALTTGISASSLSFLAWYSAAVMLAQYLYGPISHGNLATDFQSDY